VKGLYDQFQHLIHEIAKFGVVGIIAYIITVGVFNILRFGGPDGEGVLFDRALTAQAIAVVVATTFAYFANRHWTWKDRERTGLAREYTLFFLINGVTLVVTLILLWFSHYVLGLKSPLADNISANVVGLIIGTAMRFYAYRRWVFPVATDAPASADSTAAVASGSAKPPASA
jgi:putative flippase GtrA